MTATHSKRFFLSSFETFPRAPCNTEVTSVEVETNYVFTSEAVDVDMGLCFVLMAEQGNQQARAHVVVALEPCVPGQESSPGYSRTIFVPALRSSYHVFSVWNLLANNIRENNFSGSSFYKIMNYVSCEFDWLYS